MERSIRRVFLGAELLIYLTFLLMDLLRLGDTTVLKFASICMVGLMGVITVPIGEIRWALIFTVAADVFLLVLDDYYCIGIALFLLAQICYALYLDDTRGLVPRMICVALAVGLFCPVGSLEALAAGYITLFFCNLIRAGRKTRENPLFFFGMLLYFCCDLCVGMFHISTGALYEFARVAMWAFYLPGQVLILLSAWKHGGSNE